MKKNALILLIVLFVFVNRLCAEEEKLPNLAGLGVVISQSPYKGDDSSVAPVPILYWEGERFFVKGTRAGIILNRIFAGDEKMGFDLFLEPRFMGYESDDSNDLNGMEDRDWSLDLGIGYIWKMSFVEGLTFDASFAGDITSEHEGSELNLGISKLFDFKPFFFKPYIGIEWQSEDLVDHYYGVRTTEATATRVAYTADDTVNFQAKFDFYMGLSEEWLIVSRLGIDVFGDEIKDSPIVDEDYTVTGLIGLTYMF